MNERIKELAVEAGAFWRPGYVVQSNGDSEWQEKVNVDIVDIDLEKFAELIVKECTNTLRTEMYRLDAIPGREVSAQTMETAQDLINNHFGVEL